ncbi:hypothetical protein GCM10011584_18000 [Nocardioides phosphati]|uniref:Uncharacterized protein n=1 Tax=Nocardioides phosphati TaxID=1867775 RepID=A0ABQ2NAY2_9ACTN|nr:hypothetical protein GCM10011584_18000 [Nocardioides phosphati]
MRIAPESPRLEEATKTAEPTPPSAGSAISSAPPSRGRIGGGGGRRSTGRWSVVVMAVTLGRSTDVRLPGAGRPVENNLRGARLWKPLDGGDATWASTRTTPREVAGRRDAR